MARAAFSQPDQHEALSHLAVAEVQLGTVAKLSAETAAADLCSLTAAMLAHEVNNLLTPMMFHVEKAIEEAAANAPLARRLAKIDSGLTNALQVVRQLVPRFLTSIAPPESAELLAAIRQATTATGIAPSKLRGFKSLHETHIAANSVALRQVLVNILLNALEASQSTKPNLTIKLKHVVELRGTWNEGTLVGPSSWPMVWSTPLSLPEAAAFLTIRDGGRGFSKSGNAKHNTNQGLGLPICASLLHAARGAMAIWSMPAKGTVVGVVLPLATAQKLAA